jgi:hypothetical protein
MRKRDSQYRDDVVGRPRRYAIDTEFAFLGVLTMELGRPSVPVLFKFGDDEAWRCHMQVIEQTQDP